MVKKGDPGTLFGVFCRPTVTIMNNIPHIKYFESDQIHGNDVHLYYVGTKYPLNRLQKYRLHRASYSPSKEVPRKDVWVVVDENHLMLNYPDGSTENIPGITKLHVELSEFTDDISTWRDNNLEKLLSGL